MTEVAPVPAPGGGQSGRSRERHARLPAVSFDDFAERYAQFNQLRDRLLPTADWLESALPGGGRAVDLGCGDGLHTVRLARRYGHVLGVDLSARLLEIARSRPHPASVRYQQCDVMDLTPQRDGRFDAVITVNTLHHVGPLDLVLPHVRQLVAPSGWLVAADIVDTGHWSDRGWHISEAFAGARSFYELAGGDPDVAADTLRLLLHPRWLDMSTTDLPPTRAQWRAAVDRWCPGAVVNDDLHPVMSAFAWQAPAHG